MNDSTELHRVKTKEANKDVKELLKMKEKSIKKEKTEETITCGTVECIPKPSLWEIIKNFFKKIFKR